MLHIVNGDVVAEKLKQGTIQGDILVWREIYTEGPVFADPSDPAGRSLRADYLETALEIPRRTYISGCEEQEQRLLRFKEYDEVVLWFEHDLFDQTILCRLLHWFSGQELGHAKLNLLCIGSYPGIEPFHGLGQLSVAQLEGLSGTWRGIGQEELELGKAYWEAYTSPEPGRLARLVREKSPVLPFAHKAFAFHLSRFPSVRNGLGIVEQTLLDYASQGLHKSMELFSLAGGRLHWFGMGDIQYLAILNNLSAGPNPLVTIEGADNLIRITDTGRAVQAGETDWASLHEVDCWLGGVHLQGSNPLWRWDTNANTIVAAEV